MNKGLILGISAYYHDSAAALIDCGNIIAAAQEERFSRIKHDPSFPLRAINYCLTQANCQLSDVAIIVFYDKPFLTFDRLLETTLSYAPRGLSTFLRQMPRWLKERLHLKSLLRRELCALSQLHKHQLPQLLFTEHHQAHAASAFYPSPYQDAAVLCLDGVGEWASTSAWMGRGQQLEALWQINFPHSLGLLYSAFTYYCGFKVNSGEYKLMGLAPYGKPRYAELIKQQLIDIRADGSFKLDLSYFDFCLGNTMTSAKFHQLFNGDPRQPESPLSQKQLDLAASIQAVTEQVVIQLARTLQAETAATKLCLAGGVALNCMANRALKQANIFEHIWVQPAAGDAGGALGAALAGWHIYQQQARTSSADGDNMQGCYLGPQYSSQYIADYLHAQNITHQYYNDAELTQLCADLLSQGQVLGWFQGRMEYGPRALGNRSILADPRNKDMQLKLNKKIKFRESFRPFAPAVLANKTADYFQSEQSPYMTFTCGVAETIRKPHSEQKMATLAMMDKLYVERSQLPAITHVDYSARIQTVDGQHNPLFHQLLTAFEQLTGCPVLINTSFNVRGEPIVCSPEDAYQCFMATDMDYLILGNYLLRKTEQPPATSATRTFEAD